MGDQMRTFLRSFIIPPLLKVLDNEDPLENLTEMRKVVVVFANFVLPLTSDLEMLKAVKAVYQPLYEWVDFLNSIIYDDFYS